MNESNDVHIKSFQFVEFLILISRYEFESKTKLNVSLMISACEKCGKEFLCLDMSQSLYLSQTRLYYSKLLSDTLRDRRFITKDRCSLPQDRIELTWIAVLFVCMASIFFFSRRNSVNVANVYCVYCVRVSAKIKMLAVQMKRTTVHINSILSCDGLHPSINREWRFPGHVICHFRNTTAMHVMFGHRNPIRHFSVWLMLEL